MNKEIYPVETVIKSTINGRQVVVYSINTSIGEFFISEHEALCKEVITDYIGYDKDKALKAYNRNCTRILKGNEN